MIYRAVHFLEVRASAEGRACVLPFLDQVKVAQARNSLERAGYLVRVRTDCPLYRGAPAAVRAAVEQLGPVMVAP